MLEEWGINRARSAANSRGFGCRGNDSVHCSEKQKPNQRRPLRRIFQLNTAFGLLRERLARR